MKFPTVYNNAADILEYQAEVGGGVFKDFASICGNAFQNDFVLTLEDFANNALEVSNRVSGYFEKKPNIAEVYVFNYTLSSVEILVPNHNLLWSQKISDNSNISDDFSFSITDTGRESFCKRWDTVNRDYKQMEEILRKHLCFSVLPSGCAYINLNPSDKRMKNEVAYLGIAFLLGNLVRYEPIAISKLLNSDDSIYSLFNEICNKSLRIFPNLILNMFTEKDICFSSSI